MVKYNEGVMRVAPLRKVEYKMKKCLDCGDISIPFFGFAFNCSCSNSGIHENTVELDYKLTGSELADRIETALSFCSNKQRERFYRWIGNRHDGMAVAVKEIMISYNGGY